MDKFMTYLLTDGSTFFVGKVKTEQAERELRFHRSGKYLGTRDWFKEKKDTINIYWLTEITGSREIAFGEEIIWTRYFLDSGKTHSNVDSEIYHYATTIPDESLHRVEELKEKISVLEEERQLQLTEYIKASKKHYDSKKIAVILNSEEQAEILKLAEKAGLSMSQYLKQTGLRGKIEFRDYSEITKLTTVLSSIDQALRFLVYNDYPNKELVREEIVELTRAQNELTLEIRKLIKKIRKEG